MLRHKHKFSKLIKRRKKNITIESGPSAEEFYENEQRQSSKAKLGYIAVSNVV